MQQGNRDMTHLRSTLAAAQLLPIEPILIGTALAHPVGLAITGCSATMQPVPLAELPGGYDLLFDGWGYYVQCV